MRKISPDNVRDDFKRQLADLTTFYNTGLSAFSTKNEKSTLTEHSLLAAAVSWEGFVSEIFIAFINRDATQFKEHLRLSLEAYVKKSSKHEQIYNAFGSLSFSKHLNKADVLNLADSVGNNITFPCFEELQRKANAWLIEEHAEKFSNRSDQQKVVINSLIAMRNHIAHRSKRSLDAMNEVLSRGALQPTGIRRLDNRFSNVGAWLKATPAGGNETRFATILRMLNEIGNNF